MLQIAIVGAGGMGTVHYNNYKVIKDCKVVAIVGISENDKVQSKKWGIPLYTTIDEAVRKEAIDVIDICTPTFLHKENVLESIACKKHTIVEKPIALSVEDAKEMFAFAKEKGVYLYVAHVLQFSKEVEILKRLVKEETYGKTMDVFMERLSSCPKWTNDGWLFQKDKSGLLPYDLHIHDLDIIVSMFGKPKKITTMGDRRKGINYIEHYRWIYNYENLNVVAEAAWYHADIPFITKWRVCFENAVLFYDGIELIVYPYNEEAHKFDLTEDIVIPTGINIPPTGWYYNELGHFIKCIKAEKESQVIKSEQIIAVLEVLGAEV